MHYKSLVKWLYSTPLFVAACIPAVAHGAPAAYYNPATGNVLLSNTFPYALQSIVFISASQRLVSDANQVLEITGATRDVGELPYGVTYFDFPSGTFDAGNIVIPHTPVADLAFSYYENVGAENRGVIEIVPEPSAATAIGVLAVGMLRPFRKRRNLVRAKLM